MTIGIYMLQFSNGSKYIGQSNNISRRYEEHCHLMELHKNPGIRRAFRDCGRPVLVILEKCSLASLNSREIYWIAHYDTFRNGLNRNSGGGYNRKNVRIAERVVDCTSTWPTWVFVTMGLSIVACLLGVLYVCPPLAIAIVLMGWMVGQC